MSERGQRALAVGAVLLALGTAILAGFVRDYSGDFHWHVALGRWVLDHGQLYLTDVHSHTAAGAPYFASSWLADVLFALVYSTWEYAGAYALRAAALLLVAYFVMADATERGIGEGAAATMVTFWFATCLFLLYLRPETLAFALLAGLLWSLGRIDRTGKPGPRVAVMILLLAWPNLHGSVSIGLTAVGLASAEQVVRELAAGSRRNWRRIAWAVAMPLAAFGLSCLNPEGIALPLAIRIVSEVWVSTVAEWQPLALANWPPMALTAALTVLVTAIGAVALGRAARVPWWNLALFGVLCAFTLRYQRFLAYAMLAAVPAIVTSASEIAGVVAARPSARSWRWIGRGVVAVAMAWAIVALLIDRRLLAQVGTGPDPDARVNPAGACRFIADAKTPGPLFNTYVFGSYLMHCLGPTHPVFIDGRAWSLYSDEFYRRFRRSGLSGKELTALLAEFPSAWAIVAYDPHAAQLAARPDQWRLVYFDDEALVYLNASHPATASLAATLPHFSRLEPSRLIQLTDATGPALEQARTELSRQRIRCPSCFRTEAAAAAIAIAAGDDREFERITRRLVARGETAELAFLSGRHAVARGDRRTAAAMFDRFVALGGDPRVAQHYLRSR